MLNIIERPLSKLRKLFPSNDKSLEKSEKFVDLAPITNANIETYSEALRFGVNNDRILNIALSGPYGAGKSSIIQTFDKQNEDVNCLYISLAALSDNDNEELRLNSHDIERSILQQMLYKTGDRDLPFSRFNRISKPQYPFILPTVIFFWMLSVWHLFSFKEHRFTDPFHDFHEITQLLFACFLLVVPILLLTATYKSLYGLSLKKISLKNVEIETGDLSENSILNKHLDEILYFFEETKYNLFVIEDLDRFDTPEIFVKLREINKLINENDQTSQVKFLYAVRDDLFSVEKRAKFFDLIVPVIPVINTSNSQDKIRERLSKYTFRKKISDQYIKDISLFLDDLRLINNIINEYVIYYEKLDGENLNAEKLFSIVVYKNYHPADFEQLHRNKGGLYEVFGNKKELISSLTNDLNEDIAILEASIESSDKEFHTHEEELRSIYLTPLLFKVAKISNFSGFKVGNEYISLDDISTADNFDRLLELDLIEYRTSNGYQTSLLKTSELEAQINSEKGYFERLEAVKNRSEDAQSKIQSEIIDKYRQIDVLESSSFSTLMEYSQATDYLQAIWEQNNLEDHNLLEYLISEGYINDTYPDYITLFHEGRLKKSDRDYLRAIRQNTKAFIDLKIDTPDEVVRNMRSSDFSSPRALNLCLLNYLLIHKEDEKLKKVFEFIKHDFSEADRFLIKFYSSDLSVPALVGGLYKYWPSYGYIVPDVSSKPFVHFQAIFKWIEPELIITSNRNINRIAKYLSNIPAMVHRIEFKDINILIKLGVKFDDIGQLQTEEIRNLSMDNGLYKISLSNVKFILNNGSIKDSNLIEPTYLNITNSTNTYLKTYLDENLSEYIEKVFLEQKNVTTREITLLLSHNSLDEELGKQIISEAEAEIDVIDNIPETYWNHSFKENKVRIDWKNFVIFANSKDANVKEFLSDSQIVVTLSQQDLNLVDFEENIPLKLCQAIINNHDASDDDYSALVKKIPYRFKNVPADISEEKKLIMLQADRVSLNDVSYESFSENEGLLSILMANNFENYLKNKSDYPITDEVRKNLLYENIPVDQKTILVNEFDPDEVAEKPGWQRAISIHLVTANLELDGINETILKYAIANARSDKEACLLLTRSIGRWNKTQVLDMISDFSYPTNLIAQKGKRPKLTSSPEYLAFANALKDAGYISSFSVTKTHIRINTFQR